MFKNLKNKFCCYPSPSLGSFYRTEKLNLESETAPTPPANANEKDKQDYISMKIINKALFKNISRIDIDKLKTVSKYGQG